MLVRHRLHSRNARAKKNARRQCRLVGGPLRVRTTAWLARVAGKLAARDAVLNLIAASPQYSQTSGSEGVNNAFNQLRLSSSVSSHSDVPITILERIDRRKVGNFSGAEARRFPLEKACAL